MRGEIPVQLGQERRIGNKKMGGNDREGGEEEGEDASKEARGLPVST